MSRTTLHLAKCLIPSVWLSLATILLSPPTAADAADTSGTDKQIRRVHAVSDIGHEFSFYADGRFHSQYLPGQPKVMSWGALYNFDFSNANLMILLGCESHLRYLPGDVMTIRDFLNDGGGVVLLGSGGDNPQNTLAATLGCAFKQAATKPLKSVSDEISGQIQGGGYWMELKPGRDWQVLIVDADNKPILVRKKVGKGTLLIGARGLAGSRPDAKDNINAEWWTPLLTKTAQGKQIDPAKPFRSRGLGQLEYTEELDSIKLHYSEYLKPYARAMADVYQRTKPVMRKRLGVPLSEGMASEIGLLATGGGGFSAGRMIGLAVFWGGFPEREDGMIEFITHETVHSWVLPFPEIWNEPIATYVGDLVMCDMGYEEEGTRRIRAVIDRAKKIDPTMKLYDLEGRSLQDVEPLAGRELNSMHWGKSFWIFEEFRKENPDFLADYFIAKRKLAKPGVIAKYDVNATVAVVSVAMGRNMFGWFREHGFDVDPEESKIKTQLR